MSSGSKKTKSGKKHQRKIISDFLAIKKKNGKVSFSDLKQLGHSRKSIEHHFGSLNALDGLARKKYPNRFFDTYFDHLFSEEYSDTVREKISRSKKFVITTAEVGKQVHRGFLASIKKYCKLNNAELFVLPCVDPASINAWTIDKKLLDDLLVKEINLNSNLFISTIKLSSKQINPLTGLGRIGQRNGSFIYASPKQFLKVVPVSNNKLPHVLMTTGSITVSNYAPKANYMSERTAYIANNDHVMGALIVEIKNDTFFYFRQVQADKKGHFIDLGKQYSSSGVKDFAPSALVLGDWHSGQTDPYAAACWLDICEELKPKYLVMHDLFDGLSINHHEQHKTILKAKRYEQNQLVLSREIMKVRDDLDNKLCPAVEEVVVVASNHDEFLHRYLEDGLYVHDPQNHRTSLELAIAMLDGHNPLEQGVKNVGLKSKNVRWLKRDEDFKIAGIQLGAHGDKGPNGSRGSLINLEAAYGSCVVGHSHTPGIIRDAWQVGTTSLMNLGYNEGPSSWLHSSCLVYENGSRQLIIVVDEDWKLREAA